jgi:hypothetical protein
MPLMRARRRRHFLFRRVAARDYVWIVEKSQRFMWRSTASRDKYFCLLAGPDARRARDAARRKNG